LIQEVGDGKPCAVKTPTALLNNSKHP